MISPDPEIELKLQSLTNRMAKAIWLLREWRALHYTGHFIDVTGEMKERVDATYEKTQKALSEDWNLKDIP